MTIKTIISFFTLALLFSCDPKNTRQSNSKKDQIDTSKEASAITDDKLLQNDTFTKRIPDSQVVKKMPDHFICYKSDNNSNLAISISFDKDGKALNVKYKGQEESIDLSFKKEEYLEGGAHPTIETYYSEIYEGKENGVYKLTHSGVWDYAEYTRSKDGKKFNFTINHELTIENDGYRTTPCF